MSKIKKCLIIFLVIVILIPITLIVWSSFDPCFLAQCDYYTIRKTFEIPLDGGVYCSQVNGYNTISVFIRNTGTMPLYHRNFVILQIDENDVPNAIDPESPIPSGEAGFLIEHDDNEGVGYTSGNHTIDIATYEGFVKHEIVECP